MHKKILIYIFIITAFQTSCFAQVSKRDTIPGTKGKVDVAPETVKEKKQAKKLYSISQFVKETVLFVKQPFRWKGNDWLNVGIIAGGTALLTLADQPLRHATQGNQRYYYSVPIVGGRVYGEWYSIGGVSGIFGLYGIIAHDTAAKKIAIELFQAAAYAELVTEPLKFIVGRARPTENKGNGYFHPFIGLSNRFNSFPSGHSTSAFALSTIMSRHAHSTFLKILAYVPAGFTLFSRIYQDQHWVSDELVGAGIGYFVGNWVVDLHEEKRHRINVKAQSLATY
jgi:membrane-associated phospholipid phosphatase